MMGLLRILFAVTSASILCLAGASHDRMEDVWTAWSSWSRCSTSCGQGVMFRQRECVGYDGHRVFRVENPRCAGFKHEHSTCEERACAIGSQDMYEYQCSQKNRQKISGKYHRWVPFTGMNMAARCELACIASKYNFYYNFGAALDGTPCGEPTDDRQYLCVDGMCKMFGCDGVAESHKVPDWCKVCGGENKNCSYVKDSYDTRRSKHYGYQLVIKIPAGATYIKVTDKSCNYLAISDAKDMFLINGNYMLDWPGEYPYAGTTVKYTRNSSVEIIEAEGPTNMDLYVKLIFREYNPGVHYQFFLPTSKMDAIERPKSSTSDAGIPMIGPLQPHNVNTGPKVEKTATVGSPENEVLKPDIDNQRTGQSDTAGSIVIHSIVDDHESHAPSHVDKQNEGNAQNINTYEDLTHGSVANDNLGVNSNYGTDDNHDSTIVVDTKPDPDTFPKPPLSIDPYYNFEDTLYDSANYLDDILNKRREHYAGRYPPVWDPYDTNTQNEYGYGDDSRDYLYDPSNYVYNDLPDSNNPVRVPDDDSKESPLDDDYYYYNNGIPSFNPDFVEDPWSIESTEKPQVYLDDEQAQRYPNQAFWQRLGDRRQDTRETERNGGSYSDSKRQNDRGDYSHDRRRDSDYRQPYDPYGHELGGRSDHFQPYDPYDPQPASRERHDQGRHTDPTPASNSYVNEDANIWNQILGQLNGDHDRNRETGKTHATDADSHNNGYQGYLIDPQYDLDDQRTTGDSKGAGYDPKTGDLRGHQRPTEPRGQPVDPGHDLQHGNIQEPGEEHVELLHIDNSKNFNYNQPNQNYPGDPFSQSFRQHESNIDGLENGENKGRDADVIKLEVQPIERTTQPPIANQSPTQPPPVNHLERDRNEDGNDLYDNYLYETDRDGGAALAGFDWPDYDNYGREQGGKRKWDQYGAHCPMCPRNIPNKKYICDSDIRLRGLIDNAEEIRGDTRYEVRVIDTFDSKVPLMKREYIWAKGACPCPLLKVNEEYLLTGRLISNFQTRESRLMLEDNGYITDFKTRHLARFRSILKTISC